MTTPNPFPDDAQGRAFLRWARTQPGAFHGKTAESVIRESFKSFIHHGGRAYCDITATWEWARELKRWNIAPVRTPFGGYVLVNTD